jgi:hypothetical protein
MESSLAGQASNPSFTGVLNGVVGVQNRWRARPRLIGWKSRRAGIEGGRAGCSGRSRRSASTGQAPVDPAEVRADEDGGGERAATGRRLRRMQG